MLEEKRDFYNDSLLEFFLNYSRVFDNVLQLNFPLMSTKPYRLNVYRYFTYNISGTFIFLSWCQIQSTVIITIYTANKN